MSVGREYDNVTGTFIDAKADEVTALLEQAAAGQRYIFITLEEISDGRAHFNVRTVEGTTREDLLRDLSTVRKNLKKAKLEHVVED